MMPDDGLSLWAKTKAWLQAEALREQERQQQTPVMEGDAGPPVTPATWTLQLLERAQRTTAQDIHAIYKRLRTAKQNDINGG